MTSDQRLILKLEQVSDAVAGDRLLAAYHMLDEILRDLDVPKELPRSGAPARRMPRPGSATPTPFAAAG